MITAAILILSIVWLLAAGDFWIPWLCNELCGLFPSRSRVVPKADDPSTPLLLQFMIWPGRLYLQHFLHPETAGLFHRHRWEKMRSIVLSGGFVEERPESHDWISHHSLSTYSMTHEVIHRVAFWSQDCWTLFYMSKERSDDWGYFRRLPDGTLSPMISWREAIKCRVPSLEKGVIEP